MEIFSIATLTVIISFLLGVSGYFINRWISDVDLNIKKVNQSLNMLKQDVIRIQVTSNQIKENNVDHAIDLKKHFLKVDAKLEHQSSKIDIITARMNDTDKTLENYGKVIKVIVEKVKKN